MVQIHSALTRKFPTDQLGRSAKTNPNERNVIYYSLRYTPLIRDQLCVINEKIVVVIALFIHMYCDNNVNHIYCDNNVKFHSVVSEGLSRRERLTK